MAITATLIAVKTSPDNLILTAQFKDGTEILATKEFVWPITDVPNLTVEIIRTKFSDYKNSLTVTRNRITWLKNMIGQEV